jgi:hypothetical protein
MQIERMEARISDTTKPNELSALWFRRVIRESLQRGDGS